MACQIVIPMSGSDRIEEVLPYLESVAQPKMKAVFLIHVGLSHFDEITAQLLASDTGLVSGSFSARNDNEFAKEPLRFAKEKILPRCTALRAGGMEITVSVFTGSWREAVRAYARNEEVHLVMMRGQMGNWLSRVLRRFVSHLRRFKATPPPPPVLLFHPNSIPGRLR